MEVDGTAESGFLKSFWREQTVENGLGCDVGGFYCFWGSSKRKPKGSFRIWVRIGGILA